MSNNERLTKKDVSQTTIAFLRILFQQSNNNMLSLMTKPLVVNGVSLLPSRQLAQAGLLGLGTGEKSVLTDGRMPVNYQEQLSRKALSGLRREGEKRSTKEISENDASRIIGLDKRFFNIDEAGEIRVGRARCIPFLVPTPKEVEPISVPSFDPQRIIAEPSSPIREKRAKPKTEPERGYTVGDTYEGRRKVKLVYKDANGKQIAILVSDNDSFSGGWVVPLTNNPADVRVYDPLLFLHDNPTKDRFVEAINTTMKTAVKASLLALQRIEMLGVIRKLSQGQSNVNQELSVLNTSIQREMVARFSVLSAASNLVMGSFNNVLRYCKLQLENGNLIMTPGEINLFGLAAKFFLDGVNKTGNFIGENTITKKVKSWRVNL